MAKRRADNQIGRESNYQVGNCPNLLVCRWHASYHWNFFDKGYNFALDFTSIKGLHKKLCASKVTKVPISRISGFSTLESRDKMTFGCKARGQDKRIL
jgi:hypothetical protein